MKIQKAAAAAALICAMATAPAMATETTPAPVEETNAEVQRMLNRLEEIKAMDIEHMPRSERKKYAREVKHIQKELKTVGNGVYISVGALIIIILLLILIL